MSAKDFKCYSCENYREDKNYDGSTCREYCVASGNFLYIHENCPLED